MPCDSITTQTISQSLSKAMPDLVQAALKAIGYTIQSQDAGVIIAYKYGQRITWQAGKGLTIGSSSDERGQEIIGKITHEYSKAAVSWAAQRAGWTVQATGNNTMKLQRR